MKALIVEDDITSRKVLEKLLAPYAECDLANDGHQAVDAFGAALAVGENYDLVMLDIMMPEIDGHEVLKEIRKLEQEHSVAPQSTAKVVMTTALDDSSNVLSAFQNGCEAYIVKPIDKEKLYFELRKLGLLDSSTTD